MLEQLVRMGVERGADLRTFSQAYKEWNLSHWFVTSNVPPVIILCFRHPTIKDLKRGYNITLPDLIADAGFMGAVVGIEPICERCGCKSNGRGSCNRGCGLSQMVNLISPAIYHAIEALRLIHEGKDAVKYLVEEGEKNGNTT
jgi:hypothetical protein